MNRHSFTLRDAIEGVLNQKKLVLFLFVMILGIVGAVTLLSPKLYESEAKVFVRLGRENVGLDPTTTLGDGAVITTPMSRETEINSVVHLIRNRDLYEEVVDAFGPEQILRGTPDAEISENNPVSDSESIVDKIKRSLRNLGVLNDTPQRELAIIQVSKKLSVEAMDRSNVIRVSYETKHPKLAQQVVTFLLDRYVELHARLHRSSGTQEFMELQASEIEEQLRKKSQELELFKIETGMVSSELQKQALVTRIATINSQIRDASVEAKSLQSAVDTLSERFKAISSSTSMSNGSGNDGIDGMRQDLYRQELLLAELKGRFSETHPKVVAHASSVEEAREILVEAEASRTNLVMSTSPVFSEIQIELVKKETELAAATERLSSLRQELDYSRKSLVEFSQNERKFLDLARQLEVQEETYRRYARSVSQASVDNSLEENKLTNISVSQAASFSEKPVRPNKLVNLIIGLFLATSGSLGTATLLAYMNSTIRTEESLQETLGLPIIGTISYVPQRALTQVIEQ